MVDIETLDGLRNLNYGYTGEWGSDGRLALLHQKELVLNKEDTANMLNAISIMRNITNMLGSSVLGKLAAATAGGLGTEVGGDVLEQNVHIDAQFPIQIIFYHSFEISANAIWPKIKNISDNCNFNISFQAIVSF